MITKINNIKRLSGLASCAFAAALVALPLTSCSDFLEIKPQNEIILEDFWNEKADVDNIVAGCYSGLQNSDVMRRMIIWGEARSENIMAGQNINNDADLENIIKENITAKNGYTKWDGFYSVINRCNTVIKYAPSVAAIDPGYTQSELKATIAEVSALRDLCYFYLIRTFRDVPYSTVAFTDDDQKMDLPATPFYDVLDSLILDLETVKNDAVKRYPEEKPKYQTARITQDAIHAMLCEMYLWKKDYANCIKYADLVINSLKDMKEEKDKENNRRMANKSEIEARLNGFPLVPDGTSSSTFGQPYSTIFIQGNSQETIFELYFDDEPQRNSMLSNSAVGSLYGNTDVDRGLLAAAAVVTDELAMTSGRSIYADKNKKVDARLYENCRSDGGAIVKFVYERVSIEGAASSTSTAALNATYSNRMSSANNGSKWIIYRLPDIMLLKAEAICQQMREGSDEETVAYNKPLLEQAFLLVNAINKRSVCQTASQLKDTLVAADYGTKATMEELVMQERQRELMFEGKRWYDLVRRSLREGNTEKLSAAVMKREAINGQYVQNFIKKETAIFWPYNFEELKVNLNLVQNPSFGSGEDESYEKAK